MVYLNETLPLSSIERMFAHEVKLPIILSKGMAMEKIRSLGGAFSVIEIEDKKEKFEIKRVFIPLIGGGHKSFSIKELGSIMPRTEKETKYISFEVGDNSYQASYDFFEPLRVLSKMPLINVLLCLPEAVNKALLQDADIAALCKKIEQIREEMKGLLKEQRYEAVAKKRDIVASFLADIKIIIYDKYKLMIEEQKKKVVSDFLATI